MAKRFIQVIDDFYPKPDNIRQKALEMSYTEPESLVGWRTRPYQPRGIKGLIEKKFRLRIKYWEKDLTTIESYNGEFFSAFSRGNHAETVGIHYDTPASWMMLLIYLTPSAPYDAGTSLWQHRKTGLIAKPTQKDAERLGIGVAQLNEMLARDNKNRRHWKEIDRIGNIYNRAVIFPSRLLHSATRHFGSNRFNGRLYQTFHFPMGMSE
ncbi:MAG TPA: DUF6445 family protein [Nitrososphaera sp.]|nr:DUF6445 family protein [Nitrososphaera sp.]